MPYISNEFIEALLCEVDIISVFQREGIELRKKGRHYFCLSPFNEEKTPSCMINAERQSFTDFSSDKRGNAITFLMEKKRMSYPEAIEELAKQVGKPVVYDKVENATAYQEKKQRADELKKYNKSLARKFQQELFKLDRSHPAWQEIKKRNYTEQEVKDYGLGFAPGHQFIYNLFAQNGAVQIGKDLDLITDKNQDKFFNVLVYPLIDELDNVLGFARRRLDDNKEFGKWLNPTETDIYKKDQFLYGLNFAKNSIYKENRVWLTEGYNDVIAWQKFGIPNTVGTNGTALTTKHIQKLKKLTSKITLCLDGDKAGKDAMLKNIPILLGEGFQVEVCQLPNDADPDDYSRSADFSEDDALKKSLQPYIINGFEVLMLKHLSGDELDRANGLKFLVKTIGKIADITLQSIYLEQLRKVSKQSPAVLKTLMQEQEAQKVEKLNASNEDYILPKQVTTPIDILLPIIKNYQLFISDNEIFVEQFNEYGANTFESISNFSIEILQHMNDEKFPSKLVKVCNVRGEERIFDMPANSMTAPQRFKDILTNQGNYQFYGNQKELDKLTAYLYDKMGVGRKIDVLGWNAEGFFCWNNSVTVPGQPNIEIDKNGLFHFEGQSFYVPSANEIYKGNAYKFVQQKRIILSSAKYPFSQYLEQMVKVHREYGILGMLFAFAAAHQDLIVDVAKGFPLFFLYGPPSTGKDELYACMKKMFGIIKTDFINLENKQSTGKAKLRSFGEFSNMLVHLSEFTNGDKEIDGMLKGLWDRGSYRRATLDSNVSTDSTPILCAAIVTGNQSPTDEAVLTRLIYGEMTKNQFTREEITEFELLEKMTSEGITEYMQKIVWHRPLFQAKFGDKFNLYKKALKEREAFKGVIDRIITNYAILGATHEILKETNEIIFPFSTGEMLSVFDDFVQNLRRKLDSANVFNKFWDVFLACLSGSELTKLHLNIHLKLEGNLMYLRFTEIYNRIQTEWFPRFGEPCPNRQTLLEKLKADSCYIKDTKSTRIGSANTSAYVVDLNKISIKENILFALNMQQEEQQLKENGIQNLFSPATPTTESVEGDSADELGF